MSAIFWRRRGSRPEPSRVTVPRPRRIARAGRGWTIVAHPPRHLADDPEAYLRDTGWASLFGIVMKEQIENYARVASLRVWYENGLEVWGGFHDPQLG